VAHLQLRAEYPVGLDVVAHRGPRQLGACSTGTRPGAPRFAAGEHRQVELAALDLGRRQVDERLRAVAAHPGHAGVADVEAQPFGDEPARVVVPPREQADHPHRVHVADGSGDAGVVDGQPHCAGHQVDWFEGVLDPLRALQGLTGADQDRGSGVEGHGPGGYGSPTDRHQPGTTGDGRRPVRTLGAMVPVSPKRIAIGSDHAGFELKSHLVSLLTTEGHHVLDLGTDSTESVDYPPFCAAVGRAVRDGQADVGIVLGGSGQGEQLAANKVHGVRAALCNDLYTARMARAHNDANVLSMGARVVGVGLAEEIVQLFLSTPFDGGRHQRRVAQLAEIEATEAAAARAAGGN
jgi:ribose 5-phosphate isomerase B